MKSELRAAFLPMQKKLTAAICKSLGIVQIDSPLSCHAPVGTKRPDIFFNTFPVHEQIEYIMIGSLQNGFSLLSKSLPNFIQWKQSSLKMWSISVVNTAILTTYRPAAIIIRRQVGSPAQTTVGVHRSLHRR